MDTFIALVFVFIFLIWLYFKIMNLQVHKPLDSLDEQINERRKQYIRYCQDHPDEYKWDEKEQDFIPIPYNWRNDNSLDLTDKRVWTPQKKNYDPNTLGTFTGHPDAPSAFDLFPTREKKEKNNSKEGYVYLIQDIDSGLYKIGKTVNLQRRMRELKVGSKTKLIESKFVIDANLREKELHNKYKNFRLPQTEYFKLDNPPEI